MGPAGSSLLRSISASLMLPGQRRSRLPTALISGPAEAGLGSSGLRYCSGGGGCYVMSVGCDQEVRRRAGCWAFIDPWLVQVEG